MTFPAGCLDMPRLELIEDRSDTWSHGVSRYPEGPGVSAQWNKAWTAEQGPLMAAAFQTGKIGDSTLLAEWRAYADESFVELRLRIHWRETSKLLKFTLPLPEEIPERRDGIPGASLLRPNDQTERPLRDWTLCATSKDASLGVVAPDVYALDGTPARLRFTLLRSPVMTHHDPYGDFTARARLADQGEHEFRFRFFYGNVTGEQLERQALMLHRPLLSAELTRGMPQRWE
jgi:alpha-mannosidase